MGYDDLGLDLGAAWRAVSFDDASWPTAAGLLGFGDDDVDTTIASDAGTYYFRRTIDLAAVPETITLRLLADDGALVHVNEFEVARQNLPEGPVDFGTMPETVIWGPAERLYVEYEVPPELFQAGNNVIAVEVHNYSIDSSDLAFSLELLGQ